MKQQASYSLGELVSYFLRLGALGFGGPPALVSAMHRGLVSDRQWITEADYREGMALSQLAPGNKFVYTTGSTFLLSICC